MSGLRHICKLYGAMSVVSHDGQKIKYVWDYAADKPVDEKDMPFGSERHKLSERAKWLSEQGES